MAKREVGAAAVPSKTTNVATRAWVSFDIHGNKRVVDADKASKHKLMRMMKIPARDLRLLDPGSHAPASILSRERALVIILEYIHMVLCADQVCYREWFVQSIARNSENISLQARTGLAAGRLWEPKGRAAGAKVSRRSAKAA